jgi:hypothetical protein
MSPRRPITAAVTAIRARGCDPSSGTACSSQRQRASHDLPPRRARISSNRRGLSRPLRARSSANGDKQGGPALFTEVRCRICRNPQIRRQVNDLLANGFTFAAIIDMLAPVNATLPHKSQITDDCVSVHRKRHFAAQVPAAELWRKIQEQYAAEEASREQGIVNILTPAAYDQSSGDARR